MQHVRVQIRKSDGLTYHNHTDQNSFYPGYPARPSQAFWPDLFALGSSNSVLKGLVFQNNLFRSLVITFLSQKWTFQELRVQSIYYRVQNEFQCYRFELIKSHIIKYFLHISSSHLQVWIKSVRMSASVQGDTQENSVRQKSHFVPARNSVLAKMAENVLIISPTTPVNAKKASVAKTVQEISMIVLIICAR